jgi:hypothetical protein
MDMLKFPTKSTEIMASTLSASAADRNKKFELMAARGVVNKKRKWPNVGVVGPLDDFDRRHLEGNFDE